MRLLLVAKRERTITILDNRIDCVSTSVHDTYLLLISQCTNIFTFGSIRLRQMAASLSASAASCEYKSTSRLVDLPLELQHKIFCYYFGDYEIHYNLDSDSIGPPRKGCPNEPPNLSLLHTCRHINREADALFKSCFSGRVQISGLDLVQRSPSAPHWLFNAITCIQSLHGFYPPIRNNALVKMLSIHPCPLLEEVYFKTRMIAFELSLDRTLSGLKIQRWLQALVEHASETELNILRNLRTFLFAFSAYFQPGNEDIWHEDFFWPGQVVSVEP